MKELDDMPHAFARTVFVVALASLASACASPDPFAALGAERGVFSSPYVAPEISRQGIGPEPEGALAWRRPYLDTLRYPGRGRVALDRNGNLVRLSRHDARILRERTDALRRRAEEIERAREGGGASPPPPMALPSVRP
jgi:hypothetical protein